jgi:hypothetical protein
MPKHKSGLLRGKHTPDAQLLGAGCNLRLITHLCCAVEACTPRATTIAVAHSNSVSEATCAIAWLTWSFFIRPTTMRQGRNVLKLRACWCWLDRRLCCFSWRG